MVPTTKPIVSASDLNWTNSLSYSNRLNLVKNLCINNLSDKTTWNNNYVGKIVSFASKQYAYVPTTKDYRTTVTIYDHYQAGVNWIGLKLYEGITNEIIPVKPWKPDCTFWIHPSYLYDLNKIIEYESTEVGDYVTVGNHSGIVTTINNHRRPKFYKTNSLTCKSIVVWCTNVDGHVNQKLVKVPKRSKPFLVARHI